MNAKGFLGILNNLDMLTDADINKVIGEVKPAHLSAAIRNRNLRKSALKLMMKRSELIEVLSRGGKSLIERVEALMDDEDGPTAKLAVQVLGRLPKESLPAKRLQKTALRAINPEVQSTAAEKKRALTALGLLNDQRAIDLVAHIAQTDRLKSVRDKAWLTLAQMGEAGQRRLMAEARKQARYISREPNIGLIKALSLVSDERAADILARMMGHTQCPAAGQAIVQSLTSLCQDSELAVRRLADVVSGWHLKSPAILKAVQCLASLKTLAASRAMLRILRSRSVHDQASYFSYLTQMPGKAAISYLVSKAIETGCYAEHGQKAVATLISHKGKHVFSALCSIALTGNEKEAKLAKRVLRKRGETAKFRERLLSGI